MFGLRWESGSGIENREDEDCVATQRLKDKWLGHWAGRWEKEEVLMIHSSNNSGEPGMRRFMSPGVWYNVGSVFPLIWKVG